MKHLPVPPDGTRALSTYRYRDGNRGKRIVAWLIALPVFVALFPWFGIILPVPLAIVLYVVLLEWGRPDKHDPWALLAIACLVAGAGRVALTDHIIATSGGRNLGGDAAEYLPDFALLGAAFLSAALSLVSLHFRPRRHGTTFALCCLVQAPHAAALQYCFLYGPEFVPDFHEVRPVELVHSNHAWTREWKRTSGESVYRVRADGWWSLRPPAGIHRFYPPYQGRIRIDRPVVEGVNSGFALARRAYMDFPYEHEGCFCSEQEDEGVTPCAQPIALLVEAEVPWLWIEAALLEFEVFHGFEQEFPEWTLHAVVASAPDGTRSLPLLLLLDRRLADDEGRFPLKRLVIDRQGSSPGAPVEYGFDGRFELDPGPIAEWVGACWAAGGAVELDLDPELPWADFVDFLDRTWIGAPPQDRTCRIVLPVR